MVTALARGAVRALSADAALLQLLDRGHVEARVHSVFRRVVNVVTTDGRLVSLCAREHDDAPWSLRAEVDDWTPWHLPTGAPVSLDRAMVRLGAGPPLTVAGARAWDVATTPITAGTAQLSARADDLAATVRRYGVPGGVLPGPAPDPFAALVSDRIGRGLADLVTGELAGSEPDVEAAAASLLGLGPGLTPAGDDALTGLALVVARPGSLATTVAPALRRVLHRHGDRTTDLSRVTLAAALDGRARQSLLDLVDVLVSRDHADPRLLRERAERVIRIGHTSGTDLVSGVLVAIQLEIQRRGSACPSPQ